MHENLFAYTAPGASYPEYISVNKHSEHEVEITVRSPASADGGEGATAAIRLSAEQVKEMVEGLSKG